jgi:hypothetical protein
MEPTLASGDLVATVPVDGWHGEGLYVFEFLGNPDVYRCSSSPREPGKIEAHKDNKHYSPFVLTVDQFERAVIGAVVATCVVINRSLLLAAAGPAGRP